jgi:hypothetical protein
MNRRLVSSMVFLVFALTLTGLDATTRTASTMAETLRVVYFSAVDSKGVQVTDLTAADLTVKEGGKDRVIASVRPATGPMHVSLLVDDAGTGAFQPSVAQFLQTMLGRGQFAIRVLSPQPIRVASFTEDVVDLRAAIGRMGPRGRLQIDGDQIIGGVSDAAKELVIYKAVRPAIVVLSASGETVSSDIADEALNALKNSGASLSVLYITGVELGKVLGDGPKQSGGMMQAANGTAGVSPALTKITNSLMNQYVLTYIIPDGVKLSERISVSTSRKGVTLIAPTRLSDK